MTVVVWGAAGYTGSALTRYLCERGYRVIAVARCWEGRRRDGIESFEAREVLADVAGFGARWLEGRCIFVNLAGRVAGGREELYRSNVEAQEEIATCAKRISDRAIHLSTTNIQFATVQAYGDSKRAGEVVWADTIGGDGLCIVRPALIYGGPRDRKLARLKKYFAIFPFFPACARARVAPVYIEDFCEEISNLISTSQSGVYDMRGPEDLRYSEFIGSWAEATGMRVRFVPVASFVVLGFGKLLRYLPFMKGMGVRLWVMQQDRRATTAECLIGETSIAEGMARTISGWDTKGEKSDG